MCRLSVTLVVCSLLAAPVARAQESPGSDAAQTNNPLANFRAFNLQNHYVPSLSELDGQNANTFWLRYAQPFGRVLFRASLPLNRVPTGPGTTTSGLGDFNANFFYLLDTGNPARSFGIGPQVSLDTATEDETGSGKYQVGLSGVYFDASSPRVQWGDTHLHTSNSLDARATGATLGPEEAFRFARGDEVTSAHGQRLRLSRPLHRADRLRVDLDGERQQPASHRALPGRRRSRAPGRVGYSQGVSMGGDLSAAPAGDALRFGVELPAEAPRSHQERAYTSPIWYTPSN